MKFSMVVACPNQNSALCLINTAGLPFPQSTGFLGWVNGVTQCRVEYRYTFKAEQIYFTLVNVTLIQCDAITAIITVVSFRVTNSDKDEPDALKDMILLLFNFF